MDDLAPDQQARAQELYDELNKRGVFKGDPRAQELGHELRARGVVSDPTQGGLVQPQQPANPAPVATPPQQPINITVNVPGATATVQRGKSAPPPAPFPQPEPQAAPQPRAAAPQQPVPTAPPHAAPVQPHGGYQPLGAQPLQFKGLPQEDLYFQQRNALKKQGPLAADLSHRGTPGGPLDIARQPYYHAALDLGQHLPQMQRDFQVAATNYQKQAQQFAQRLKALRTLYGIGPNGQLNLPPDVYAQVQHDQQLLSANQQMLQHRSQRLQGYAGQVQPIFERFQNQPLHNGPLTPYEAADQGRQGFFGALSENTMIGPAWDLIKSGAGAVDRALVEKLPAERRKLMLEGKYPALPNVPPNRMAEFQQLRDLYFNMDPVLGPVPKDYSGGPRVLNLAGPGGGIPQVFDPKAQRQQRQAALAKMSPWARSVAPILEQQSQAEAKAFERAKVDQAVNQDAITNLVAEIAGGAVAGGVMRLAGPRITGPALKLLRQHLSPEELAMVEKNIFTPAIKNHAEGILGRPLAMEEVRTGFAKPLQELLQNFGAPTKLAKLVAHNLPGIAAGAGAGAVGGGSGAAAGEYYASHDWKRAKAAGVAAMGPGALLGGVTAAVIHGAGGLARHGTPEAAPPKAAAPKSHVEVEKPGPQVHMPDGSVLDLRLTPTAKLEQALNFVPQDHPARAVLEAAIEHRDQRAAQMSRPVPKGGEKGFLEDWNNPGNTAREQVDTINAHADKVEAAGDPDTAATLRKGANDIQQGFNQNWIDQHFREWAGDYAPTDRVSPPEVSAWRQLTPEQRASLPKEVQRALLTSDISNSRQVIDPTTPHLQQMPGVLNTTRKLVKQADAQYGAAHDALSPSEPLQPGPAATGEIAPPQRALELNEVPAAQQTPAEPQAPDATAQRFGALELGEGTGTAPVAPEPNARTGALDFEEHPHPQEGEGQVPAPRPAAKVKPKTAEEVRTGLGSEAIKPEGPHTQSPAQTREEIAAQTGQKKPIRPQNVEESATTAAPPPKPGKTEETPRLQLKQAETVKKIEKTTENRADAERLNESPKGFRSDYMLKQDEAFNQERQDYLKEHGKEAPAGYLATRRARIEKDLAPSREGVTGLLNNESLVRTLDRAQEHVKKTGETAHFFSVDLKNLGGLNPVVGHSGGNTVLRDVVDMIQEELAPLGAHQSHYKVGGDEFGGVLVGQDRATIDAALERVKQRVQHYNDTKTFQVDGKTVHLKDIPHPKPERAGQLGTGIEYQVEPVTGKESGKAVLDRANDTVETRKKEASTRARAAQELIDKLPVKKEAASQSALTEADIAPGKTIRNRETGQIAHIVKVAPDGIHTTTPGQENTTAVRTKYGLLKGPWELASEQPAAQQEVETQSSEVGTKPNRVPTPVQQQKEEENRITNAPLADWSKQNLLANYDLAKKYGVADEVESLAAQRLTANEVTAKIRPNLPKGAEGLAKELVLAVRAARGIPSMDDYAEFEKWLASHQAKTKGPEAKQATETPSEHGLRSGMEQTVNDLTEHLQTAIGNGTQAFKNNPELMEFVGQRLGGTIAGGHFTTQDAYDALETAVNKIVAGTHLENEPPGTALNTLTNILERLPTQTARTQAKVEFQQFSTPPHLAYAAAYLLNPKDSDTILEPSAGTGSLAAAAHAVAPKAQIVTNEIDPQRAGLLKLQGYTTHNKDAERLNSTLPQDVQPTAILMNPPFSATGGRVSRHSNEYGMRHLEQALKRLAPGGRLVAIMGRGMGMDKPSASPFWNRIKSEYNVRANVPVNGREYTKYGTSFDNQLIVIDKKGATSAPIYTQGADTLKELLENIHAQGLLRRSPAAVAAAKPASTQGATAVSTGTHGGTRGAVVEERGSGTGSGRSGVSQHLTGENASTQSGERVSSTESGSQSQGTRQSAGERSGAETAGTHGERVEQESEHDFRRLSRVLTPVDLAKAQTFVQKTFPNSVFAKKKTKDLKTLYTYLWMEPQQHVAAQLLGLLDVRPFRRAGDEHAAFEAAQEQQFIKPKKVTKTGEGAPTEAPVSAVQYAEGLDSLAAANAGQAELAADAEAAKLGLAPTESENTGFVDYKPFYDVKGKSHPGHIVQTAAMAAVEPPPITSSLHLKPETIKSGAPSQIQLEAVHYIQQRWEQHLGSGKRAGFLLGDGTGVGKNITIAASLAEEWEKGNKRHLWLSVNQGLYKDAKEALEMIGYGHIPIYLVNDFKGAEALQTQEGIIFSTYNTLIHEFKKTTPGKFAGQPRRAQLQEWLHPGSVLVMDESHKCKNAVVSGKGKPSKTATEMGILDGALPDAKILYSSATGATEVRNLAYMSRLGLWGLGTSFPGGVNDFIGDISSRGIGAMEVVARDLKSVGAYVSRNLSYEGVSYDEHKHELTTEDREVYDTAARIMQRIMQDFAQAVETTNMGGGARSKMNNQFWSTHQRFFRTLLTSLKTPALIEQVRKSLAKDHSVIISLIGTNEGKEEQKAAEAAAEGIPLDELDFSPKEVLIDLVKTWFPTQNWVEEEITDEEGKMRLVKTPVFHEDGTPELNPEAVAAQNALLAEVAKVYVPENPLDQILQAFGHDKVAEISGRKKRREYRQGKVERVSRGGSAPLVNKKEEKAFQSGQKRVVIITKAGDTGISLHSSLSAKNQQQRDFYMHELPWAADSAMQTLGRGHRTNQKFPPRYILMSTNAGGEARFSSTIARRLAQLGALTRGQRGAAAGKGDKLSAYNFENSFGESAVGALYVGLMHRIGGLQTPLPELNAIGRAEARNILTMMGLLREDSEGQPTISKDALTDVPKFLNRVLALALPEQNALFDVFQKVFEGTIRAAKENGEFDEGISDLKALHTKIVLREPIETGAPFGKTEHVQVEAEEEIKRFGYGDLLRYLEGLLNRPEYQGQQEHLFSRFIRNRTTGELAYAQPIAKKEKKDRYVIHRGRQFRWKYLDAADLEKRWEFLPAAGANHHLYQEEWEKQNAALPGAQGKQYHYIAGTILPIWRQLTELDNGRFKVSRVTTDDGQRVVGVEVPEEIVQPFLKRLNLAVSNAVSPADIYDSIVNDGQTVELQGGLRLSLRTVFGERAVELLRVSPSNGKLLERLGVKNQGDYQGNTRYWIPTSGMANAQVQVETLAKILAQFPLAGTSQQAPELQQRAGPPAKEPGWNELIPLSAEDEQAIAKARVQPGEQFLVPYYPQTDVHGFPVPFQTGGNLHELRHQQHQEGAPPEGEVPDAAAEARRKKLRKRLYRNNKLFRYEDALEMELQEDSAHLDQAKLGDVLKEKWRTAKHYATRDFEHLARGAEHAELLAALRRLQKGKDIASTQAILDLDHVLRGLSPAEYDLFKHAIHIEDLNEEIVFQRQQFEEQFPNKDPEEAPIDERLPGSWTEEAVARELPRVRDAVKEHAIVEEALRKRREMMNRVTAEYGRAMQRAVGKVPGFNRKHYFRHQILEFQTEHGVKGTGAKIESPTRRGFLLRRKGSGLRYNTSYIEAEYEVLSQMAYDTEVFNLIKLVKDRYDITDTLKRAAMEANDESIMPYFEDLAGKENVERLAAGKDPLTGEEMYRRILNWQQAAGFDTLGKMAAKGVLPGGDDPRWAPVIETIADAWRQQTQRAAQDVAPVSGIPESFHKDLFGYAAWLLKEHGGQTGSKGAAMLFRGVWAKKRFIKEKLGTDFVTHLDLMRELYPGYREWRPDSTNVVFRAYTLPEKVAEAIQQQIAEGANVTADQLGTVRAMGGKRRGLIVPNEVADTLDTFAQRDPQLARNWLARVSRKGMGTWKIWTLLNPIQAVPYQIRNSVGDFDAVFNGNPHTFTKLGAAAKDILAFWQHREVTPGRADLFRGWIKQGGLQGTLQAQEGLGSVSNLDYLSRLAEKKPGLLRQAWNKVVQKALVPNDIREGWLRYASYLSYMDQIKTSGNGRPRNWGASLPSEIMALGTPEEKAWALSNQLLGAYDEVSLMGQGIRQNLYPFWSWKEVNAKRWYRMAMNAPNNPRTKMILGRKIAGVAATPFVAYSVGSFVAKSLAMSGLLYWYNHTFHPDMEQNTPEYVRGRPHLDIANPLTGEPAYMTKLGNLPELLSWFNGDNAMGYAEDYLNGRKTPKEIALDMAKEIPNQLYQQVGPVKGVIEAIAGRTTFPSVAEPRPIRNRMEGVAKALSLGPLYNMFNPQPERQGRTYSQALGLTDYDPEETNYYEMMGAARDWKRKQGLPVEPGSDTSDKGNQLYYAKQALRYGDPKAAHGYLLKYAANGGTDEGFQSSMKRLDPLFGFTDKQKRSFIASLSKDDQRRLMLGYYHWQTMAAPSLNMADWEPSGMTEKMQTSHYELSKPGETEAARKERETMNMWVFVKGATNNITRSIEKQMPLKQARLVDPKLDQIMREFKQKGK